MIISDIIKTGSNEKKECKITGNGVIWLKKGAYGKRVSGKCLEPKTVLKEALTYNQILINETKKLDYELVYNYPNSNQPDKQLTTAQKGNKSKPTNHYVVNKRKVKSRLTNFLNSEQGCKSLYFYTISFPPKVTYDIAYKLLNSTLTTLRTKHGLKHYLWIAERQKIGTIHFHIAVYHFIKVRLVNDIVKKFLKHSISVGDLDWSISGANNYNGVDIAKDRVSRVPTNFAAAGIVKKITSYLTKYITKGNESFNRFAWHCSRSLCAVSDGITATIEEIVSLFNNTTLSDFASFANEWIMFFPWIKEPPPDYIKLMYDINTQRINTVC